MNKLFRLAKTEWLWYGLFAVILFAAAYIPVWQNYMSVPPGRAYYGGSELGLDLTGNLAHIQQSLNGHWRAFFNYTTEIPYAPSFLKFEYILIGKFGKLLSLSSVDSLNFVRLIISFLYCGFLVALVRKLFKTPVERVVGYGFLLFGTGIMIPGVKTEKFADLVYDALPFTRMTQAAFHYIAGGFAGVVSVFFLGQSFESSKKYAFLFLACFFGVVSTMLFAPTAVLIASSIPIFVVLELIAFLQNKISKHQLIRELSWVFIYALIIVLPLLYVRYVIAVGWAAYQTTAQLERLNPFRVSVWSYMLTVGPIYILGFFGAARIIKKRMVPFLLLLPWLLMHPVGEYIFSDMLEINRVRYFLTPYFIVYGLLGTVGLKVIADRFGAMWKTIFVIGALVTLSLSSLMYIENYRRMRECYYCYENIASFSHPKVSEMLAMSWLKSNTQESDIVLTDTFAGTIIPAFSGNKVYMSRWFLLSAIPQYVRASQNLKNFYGMYLSSDDTLSFLKKNNIRYVYLGEQEGWFGYERRKDLQSLDYPFLTEVFRSGDVAIYKVQE